jgi:hypothetical protein
MTVEFDLGSFDFELNNAVPSRVEAEEIGRDFEPLMIRQVMEI